MSKSKSEDAIVRHFHRQNRRKRQTLRRLHLKIIKSAKGPGREKGIGSARRFSPFFFIHTHTHTPNSFWFSIARWRFLAQPSHVTKDFPKKKKKRDARRFRKTQAPPKNTKRATSLATATIINRFSTSFLSVLSVSKWWRSKEIDKCFPSSILLNKILADICPSGRTNISYRCVRTWSDCTPHTNSIYYIPGSFAFCTANATHFFPLSQSASTWQDAIIVVQHLNKRYFSTTVFRSDLNAGNWRRPDENYI